MNRCAFFKHHKSSNCKNNGWVRRHCQKTCSGRGKDSWHARTYYQGIYKITGRKTYASYCAWRKNHGDCHLTSMKRTCMKTCGLCKAKKPCVNKKEKAAKAKVEKDKKKLVRDRKIAPEKKAKAYAAAKKAPEKKKKSAVAAVAKAKAAAAKKEAAAEKAKKAKAKAAAAAKKADEKT